MNAARAGRMLALLPELGRVSTPHALRLSGLSAAHDAEEIDLTQKKALQVQRLLLECMKEVLQERENRLSVFLRHLAEKNPAGSVRLRLAAILRFYSDTLRHPFACMSAIAGGDATAGSPYPEDDDIDLAAAEEEPSV